MAVCLVVAQDLSPGDIQKIPSMQDTRARTDRATFSRREFHINRGAAVSVAPAVITNLQL